MNAIKYEENENADEAEDEEEEEEEKAHWFCSGTFSSLFTNIVQRFLWVSPAALYCDIHLIPTISVFQPRGVEFSSVFSFL